MDGNNIMLTTILIAATVTENIEIAIRIGSAFLPWIVAVIGFIVLSKLSNLI